MFVVKFLSSEIFCKDNRTISFSIIYNAISFTLIQQILIHVKFHHRHGP